MISYLQFLFIDPIDSNFYLIDAYRFEAIKDTYNLSTRLSERLIFDRKIILAKWIIKFQTRFNESLWETKLVCILIKIASIF